MSDRHAVRETRRLLHELTVHLGERLIEYEKNTNPQVAALRQRIKGKLEIAEAVSDALAGDLNALKTYAG